jgi:hypothetical protein
MIENSRRIPGDLPASLGKRPKNPGKQTILFFPPREMSRTVLRHEKECRLDRKLPVPAADALDSLTAKTRQNAGIPLEKEI